jgi:hypothetical protein
VSSRSLVSSIIMMFPYASLSLLYSIFPLRLFVSPAQYQFAHRTFLRGFVLPLVFPLSDPLSLDVHSLFALSATISPSPSRLIYRVFTFSPRFFTLPSHLFATSWPLLQRRAEFLAPHTTTEYATPLQTAAATCSQRDSSPLGR